MPSQTSHEIYHPPRHSIPPFPPERIMVNVLVHRCFVKQINSQCKSRRGLIFKRAYSLLYLQIKKHQNLVNVGICSTYMSVSNSSDWPCKTMTNNGKVDTELGCRKPSSRVVRNSAAAPDTAPLDMHTRDDIKVGSKLLHSWVIASAIIILAGSHFSKKTSVFVLLRAYQIAHL